MPLGSATLNTGSLTTTQNDEVVIGAVGLNVSNTYGSASNSFTIVGESTGNPDLVIAERMVTSTGTYSSVISFSGIPPISWESAGIIISLKGTAPTANNSAFFGGFF